MEDNEFSNILADEILRRLDEPTDDRRPLKYNIQRYASIKEIIRALRISQKEITSRILCEILGIRRAKSAVPVLVECLDDPSPSVKEVAAEALGRIGSTKAGEELLNHFDEDPTYPWFAIALGAIGYRPAIPSLINALSSPFAIVRGGSAWALGELKAYEARNALEGALEKEDNEYAINRMQEALHQIKEN